MGAHWSLIPDDVDVLITHTPPYGILDVTSAGYAVETVPSGYQALELVQSESFDLVLLDINMPDQSGYETLDAERSELAAFVGCHKDELAITHFIDDRLDVLECLRGLVSNLYLFGEQRNADRIPDWAVCVADWAGTTKRVLEDLEQDR